MFARSRPALLTSALALAAAVYAPALADDAKPIALTKGERIVFLGDSITQAGAGPKGYVTLIRKDLQAKHPDLGIEVLGAGISGNKVPDLQRRVDKDVIARKPTLVVIYIGINDVWHGQGNPARGTSKDRFEAGLKEVIGKITPAGARVVLCTPSVIGEKPDGSNRNDAKLDEYADISRKVAKELKVPLCDLRKAFVGYLKEHNAGKKDRGILTRDTVHLNDAGNKFVAETILNHPQDAGGVSRGRGAVAVGNVPPPRPARRSSSL
jgi:lysophospholipase L1-like esterase